MKRSALAVEDAARPERPVPRGLGKGAWGRAARTESALHLIAFV